MLTYVVGAGGLGREVLDIALALGEVPEAFIDDAAAGSLVRGLPVIAPDAGRPGRRYCIGIAAPRARADLAQRLGAAGLTAMTLVHPRALLGPETVVGAGCLVMAGAYVSSSVRLGEHTQVQYNATVGHDALLGDRVTVLPGANVSGSVVLADDVTVGSGAVVLQGRVVGAGAFVGAGAVVTRNVAPGEVVIGSPARPLRR